jgi:hypothetical protein
MIQPAPAAVRALRKVRAPLSESLSRAVRLPDDLSLVC